MARPTQTADAPRREGRVTRVDTDSVRELARLVVDRDAGVIEIPLRAVGGPAAQFAGADVFRLPPEATDADAARAAGGRAHLTLRGVRVQAAADGAANYSCGGLIAKLADGDERCCVTVAWGATKGATA